MSNERYYDVVMTTLPGPDGEFVELEDQDGHGVGSDSGTEWVDTGDGFHRLRIPMPDLTANLEKLKRAARWKFAAGDRLWKYSGYGRNNERLGQEALDLCAESGALKRAAYLLENGQPERIRRQWRNYDL